ncbi:hypothetical protein NIES4102_06570 [Chondrocystis sp. NIES-4102]|nr:hypothetical protein NIES4102_06570 [Chondrocystis sp. NIES-4102]
MADILTHPEQFKAELKDKWLDYYQANRNWLQRYMEINHSWRNWVTIYSEEELLSLEVEDDYKPCRPQSYFIIGVVSTLEPSLQGLFPFMEYSTGNSEQIVKALGLDFDPEIELKKRSQQQSFKQTQTDLQYLDQIREEIKT